MRFQIPFIISACGALAACSISTRYLQLERSRLEADLQAAKAVGTRFSNPHYPPGERHLELFVSYNLVNQVLKGADSTTFGIPGIRDASVFIQSIRARGEDGLADLDVTAYALRGDIKVDLHVSAELLPVGLGTAQPQLQIRVRDVAPEFSWRCVHISTLLFVRKLLTVAADSYAFSKLRFPIPIDAAFAVTVPGMDETQQFPVGQTQLIVHAVRPSLPAYSGSVHVDDAIFLRDGLHVFATTGR